MAISHSLTHIAFLIGNPGTVLGKHYTKYVAIGYLWMIDTSRAEMNIVIVPSKPILGVCHL